MAEFDKYSQSYTAVNDRDAIAITGFGLDHFNRYKIRDLQDEIQARNTSPERILDFGCGVGNSLPLLAEYFPAAHIIGADISPASIEIASSQVASKNITVQLISDKLAIDPKSVDTIFSSCVFHHIPSEYQQHWLDELFRALKPGGALMIYEHNPFNPVTQYVFRNAEFDKDATMIKASTLQLFLKQAGFDKVEIKYRVFFPKIFEKLIKYERYLCGIPFGAQYYVLATKAA